MTCNNEATLEDIHSAMAFAAVVSQPSASAVAASMLSRVDWAREAISLARETGVNTARGGIAAEVGDYAEAAVVSALADQGLHVMHMNTRPNEKGIDALVFNDARNEYTVVEVKSTLNPQKHTPTLSRTKDGRQAGRQWIAGRLEAAGLEPQLSDEVSVLVMHVNLAVGTMQAFGVDDAGGNIAPLSGPVALEDAP